MFFPYMCYLEKLNSYREQINGSQNLWGGGDRDMLVKRYNFNYKKEYILRDVPYRMVTIVKTLYFICDSC